MLFPSPFSLFSSTVSRFYEIGCFANKNKVINELKPQGSQSQSNEPAVLMCAKLAQDKNYHFFAVGHSGTCYSGPYPGWRYFKYRSILNCKKGGFFVYSFGKFVLIICELDLKKRLFIKTDNINDVFSSHYMAAKSEQSQVGAKLNALAVSCYRIILNIKRLDNVSNDRIYDLTGTSHLLLAVISRQLKFLCHILPTEKDELANIYPLYELPPPLPTGEDPQGDRISPFPAKPRNGSTPINICQRMTLCAVTKTEPVGDDLQSTALRSTDDDDNSNDDDDDNK